MQGISKDAKPGYERFKLHKWSYSGLERHYFSAVDIPTAIEYAKKRAVNWSNAKLYKVSYSGSWGTALWKKPKE